MACLKAGLTKEAIYDLHTCGTMLIEDHYNLQRGEIYFMEGAGRLHGDKVIDKGIYDKLKWLNALRNSVYHRAYRPTNEDVTRAFEVIQELARKLGVRI